MIKNKQFRKALIFAVLIVGIIAMFDIFAAHSNLLGSYDDYTGGDFGGLNWWPLFFKMNIILISVLPVLYYFMIRKDFSESLAIGLTSLSLWFSGLSDLLYFWLQFQSVPQILPWLNGHIIIGRISTLIGQATVTSTTLYLSVLIGFITCYIMASWLEKVN